jgi:hypothetical protein
MNSEIELSHIKTNINAGYFGAVSYVFQHEIVNPELYDFTIISNVDIHIPDDFLYNLLNFEPPAGTGIIAPSIISISENIDKNPGMTTRPTKYKMLFYQFLYANSWFYRIFLKIRKFRIKLIRPVQYDNRIIYAAHGSLIILCKAYFALRGAVNYPVFLFGEEIFLAEELLNRKLLTIYNPSIKVFDDEHIGTSKIKIQSQCKLSYTAIKYLINKYFK